MKIVEDNSKTYRYLLRLPFSKMPQNKVLVILKNPSVATGYSSDYTINKICDYCYQNGFDEVIVANLFAYRAQKASNMVNAAIDKHEDVIGVENDNCIKDAIREVNKVIIAWGEYPAYFKDQYRKRINNVLSLLEDKDLFYVGKLSKKDGSPLHAQVWEYSMPLIKI